MLPQIIALGSIEAGQLFDYLYECFSRDFIRTSTYLNGTIWINPRSDRKEDGKESTFWHLTSREQERRVKRGNQWVIEKERLPDYRRMERIEWVRQIIVNHSNPAIKLFYHKETNKKQDIRLYLWAHAHDFVVILQKLGRSSSFLVTSFYIDHQGKRKDYERRHTAYLNKSLPELAGCEWF